MRAASGPALRARVVGARAAAAPLAVHARDDRARRDVRGRPRGVVLAPGQAALLPVERPVLVARSRPRRAGAICGVAAGVWRGEALPRAGAAAGAVDRTWGGDPPGSGEGALNRSPRPLR